MTEDFLQCHQTSETKDDTSNGNKKKDGLIEFLRYQELVGMNKLTKEYIEDGVKLVVNVDGMDGVDWPIVFEEIRNKEYPVRDLELRWRPSNDQAIEPDFVQLAKLIETHTTLMTLKFSMYSISTDNKTAVIFEAFKNNHSIKHLTVYSNDLGVKTARAFAETLMNKQSLSSLNFFSHDKFHLDEEPDPMNYQCVVELARALPTTVLEWLKINQIYGECLKALIPSLPKTLLYLNITGSTINTHGASLLQSYLDSKENTLKVLSVKPDLVTNLKQPQSSAIRILSYDSFQAKLFDRKGSLSIRPAEMNDNDWATLFMEINKDVPTSREIVLGMFDKFNLDHINYIETLLCKQSGVRYLTLQYFSADESVQTEFFRRLKQNTSIGKLKIQDELKTNSFIELTNFLTNNNSIVHLELSRCSNMSDKELIALTSALKTNINLQRLILNQSDIGDDGFQALLSSLPESLLELKVTNSLISAKSLPYLLSFVKTHSMLKELSFDDNNMTINSAPELNVADLINQIVRISNENRCICQLKINTKIKEVVATSTAGRIELSGSDVRDYSISDLYDELKKQATRKWSLNLISTYYISSVGYHHLADILTSGINITELSMYYNDVSEEAQTSYLHGLCRNKTLISLEIRGNQLSRKHMEYVESFLHNNPMLKELVLEECQIDSNSIIHLSKGLSKSNLKTLSLAHNPLDDRSYANIFSSIPTTLTKLSFRSTQITETSLQTFCTFLTTNKTLRELDINSNPISDHWFSENDICAKQLKEAAKQNGICRFSDFY